MNGQNGRDRPLFSSGADVDHHSRVALLHAWLMRHVAYRLLVALALRCGLTGRTVIIAGPFLFLLTFFLVPLLFVLKISFAEQVLARPPYSNLLEWVYDGINATLNIKLNLANYLSIFTNDLYIASYLSSLKIAAISTVLTLLMGVPIAYAIARANDRIRPILLMLVVLPFWTSFLIRVYALIGIIRDGGALNSVLIWLGVIKQPLVIMNTDLAVYIGIVYSYLPFMVLPLYANLAKMDLSLLEAAADLGCRPIKAFWVITVPLAMPGIIAGCFLVFIPAVGEFIIPDLLGGGSTLMIGKTIWIEFFNNRDWPLASAITMVLTLVLVVPIVLFQRQQIKTQEVQR